MTALLIDLFEFASVLANRAWDAARDACRVL